MNATHAANEKGYGVGAALFQKHTNYIEDCHRTERQRKATFTQLTELALAGHAVHELRCGDFLVCKYGYSHYAQDFEALQAFARRLGVRK